MGDRDHLRVAVDARLPAVDLAKVGDGLGDFGARLGVGAAVASSKNRTAGRDRGAARNRDTLALSARQADAVLSHHGLELRRQGGDHFRRAAPGDRGGQPRLVDRMVGNAECDVRRSVSSSR